MEREQFVQEKLDTLTLTMMAAFTQDQVTRLLVGYLASCELYIRDTNDGEGILPPGLLNYHNEAKRLLGLSGPVGNGTNQEEFRT